MEVITISFEQEGRNIARANAKVIRNNSRFRYLFVPFIVDNPNDPSLSVRARIIVQKKAPSEKWEDHETLHLNDMKPDQWYNIDISSSELDTILNYCLELKKTYHEVGKRELFNSRRVLILSDGENAKDAEELINKMREIPEIKEVITQILSNKNIDVSSLVELLSDDQNKLHFVDKLSFNQATDIFSRLRKKIVNVQHMKDNISNSSESFWQVLFRDNPNLLFSIIPSVFQVVCEQPYLGGKAIDNTGGKVSDYLFDFGTRNSCLIEIKTPTSALVTKAYRDSFPPSSELTGAIIQIRKQKDIFMKEYNIRRSNSQEKDINFDAYDPKCYVIIGNSDILTKEEKTDFELFRNSLKDVEIITYTELIKKLDILSQYI